MADIEASAEKIGQIIGVIDEIAFQTNLWPSTQVSRPPPGGRKRPRFRGRRTGVRALAQRSGEAAREIKQLVTGTKGQVVAGVEIVGRTQHAISSIAEQVISINEAVTGIAREAECQVSDLASATSEIGGIARAMNRSAALGARHSRRPTIFTVSSWSWARPSVAFISTVRRDRPRASPRG